ncbi:MAG: TraB/GumN family protein, partial [Candidatus Delongbacteria bacterium]
EFQLDLISGFSDQIQIKFLKNTIDEAESFDEKYSDMVQAWKDDDVVKMTKIINKEIESDPDLEILYTKLISDRNRDMTKKIEKWIREYEGEIFFVVVGAGHLTGDDGIVNLLRKKGYDVQKL